MHGDDGFTIIEALMAIAILAIGLICLYGAGANALIMSEHVSKVDLATLLAQSKLDDMSLNPRPLPAHDSGKFAGTNIRWNMVSNDFPGSPFTPRRRVLQTVVLEVTWRDGLNQKSLLIGTRHSGLGTP